MLTVELFTSVRFQAIVSQPSCDWTSTGSILPTFFSFPEKKNPSPIISGSKILLNRLARRFRMI